MHSVYNSHSRTHLLLILLDNERYALKNVCNGKINFRKYTMHYFAPSARNNNSYMYKTLRQ